MHLRRQPISKKHCNSVFISAPVVASGVGDLDEELFVNSFMGSEQVILKK